MFSADKTGSPKASFGGHVSRCQAAAVLQLQDTNIFWDPHWPAA
jgi:hypothetical protein